MTESDDQIAKLSELLREAAETHHVVYRIVDGDDPDWASWYADWLVELSELPSCSAASRCAATLSTRSCNSTVTTRARHRAIAGKTSTRARSRSGSGTDARRCLDGSASPTVLPRGSPPGLLKTNVCPPSVRRVIRVGGGPIKDGRAVRPQCV